MIFVLSPDILPNRLAQVQGENLSFGFPTRFDTNQAVRPQVMTGGLKFWFWEVEGLWYL